MDTEIWGVHNERKKKSYSLNRERKGKRLILLIVNALTNKKMEKDFLPPSNNNKYYAVTEVSMATLLEYLTPSDLSVSSQRFGRASLML